MEKTPICCNVVSLVALLILILFPVRSWCKEETYKSMTEAKPEGCVEDAELKRFDDIDYDTFVGLMGRRSAAKPNSHRNIPMSRKRHMDHILTDLLGRRTRMACTSIQEYLQERRG
ncbi:tachykinin-3b [Trachinotus anak]|uniref:tachykinin-3b n=1 Tax=Trachinotus anak TaxID=443729 RepID=UPI0039F1874F